MVTVTHSDARRGVNGDGLRGPWDTVEDEPTALLSTVVSSRRGAARHGRCIRGAAHVQTRLCIMPDAPAYLKGARSTHEESVCQTSIRREQP